MQVANGVMSTTTKVWDILVASKKGDVESVRKMVDDCPELIYAQYNYTPPVYFAVRENHEPLVKFLLGRGALDHTYITYPFKESLLQVAEDRGYQNIVSLLQQYLADPDQCKYKGDNGEINYNRSQLENEFETAVDRGDLAETEKIIKQAPEVLKELTYFWGEGILMMPAKDKKFELINLLQSFGARVPDISKWCQFYYFKHYDMAAFLLEKGMNPDHMSWHHVTLLHDMAQKGDIQKASLLIKYGADINPVDEEYKSTPLGLAAKWGNTEMVQYLLEQGADPDKAAATWASPLAWARKKGHADIKNILTQAGAHE